MNWVLGGILWGLLRRPRGPVVYADYIHSPAWARRRAAYFRWHPYRCAACGRSRGIDLHHHTYERLGHEPDADLVLLCRADHDLVHTIHRRNPARPLADVTDEVIRRWRSFT